MYCGDRFTLELVVYLPVYVISLLPSVSQVMEQRNVEGQALQDESRAASEQGSSVANMETARHQGQGAPHEVGDYILNLSFEELSNMGLSLEEPTQTHRETTQHWPMVRSSAHTHSAVGS